MPIKGRITPEDKFLMMMTGANKGTRQKPSHIESEMQRSCKRWFDLQYPKLSCLLFAVPNGGARNSREAAIMKAEGVTAGVADMILLIPRHGYGCLCIEFKTKKGSQWYFGAKLHVGVDAGTGFVHSLEVTSGNVGDSTVAAKLLREDDTVVYGDSAYSALENHEEIKNDPNFSKIDFRVNKQKPYRKNKWKAGVGTFWLKYLEYQKSRVRCKVEFVFHVIKDVFHFRKTPYRGLKKLETRAYMLMACANVYMLWAANPRFRELPRVHCA